MPAYTPIIGMEVHIELKTKSKMFCSCPNTPDLKEPNTAICEICLGHPGTLPLPNKTAIAWAVRIGQALNCSIRDVSKFDRKHYFYPDLPKGYQISQYDEPIAEHGSITLRFPLGDNIREEAVIGITRAHMEEDTAKLLHDPSGLSAQAGATLVDFNRAGVPLVEIVTDPDFKTALEAKTYCQELRAIMRALEVSDADMEKGHMRCEANVSVQEAGSFEIVNGVVKPLGGARLNHKVELKNINSFRAVEKAIAYEIARQTDLLEQGEIWEQQTRGWDEDAGETVLQRVKENAADYRYFPEPDIPPFHPMITAAGATLPELPQAKRDRFHREYGLSFSDAKFLSEDAVWGAFADAVMSELFAWLKATDQAETAKAARLAGGWMTSKLQGALAERGKDIRLLKVSPENFAELVSLIYNGKINSTNAQKILAEMIDSGVDMDPTHILEEKGYGLVSDAGQLGGIVDDIIQKFPEQVAQFKSGKEPVIKFLVGMAMKASEGTADPVMVETLLRAKLA
ncbi:MAG: Asp-tRNA(Asn)/Glu-tRNA(Gln) amidotransferase subunit GatB [Candidatus Paceibacterota bacterium]|jgi:aspartyl-tRNA(Asn)/glutamyl-tRNA(Gln) amidotransferase subunit B